MDIGVISVPQAFLYELPSASISDEVLAGWVVGILDEVSGYYKVITHYGYTGYILKSALKRVDKISYFKRLQDDRQAVVQSTFLDVLEAPSVKSKILTTLFRGSFVFVSDETVDKYIKIETGNGLIGYVPNIAIRRRLDTDDFFYSKSGFDYFSEQKIAFDKEHEIREALVHHAYRYLGVPYRWGGKTPTGIDCSGMVFMCYMLCGILIFRDSRIEDPYPIKEIPVTKASKGDLLYFPGHVAMYLGDGKYIHSTAHQTSFSCVVNSFRPCDSEYRADLADAVLHAGSAFTK